MGKGDFIPLHFTARYMNLESVDFHFIFNFTSDTFIFALITVRDGCIVDFFFPIQNMLDDTFGNFHSSASKLSDSWKFYLFKANIGSRIGEDKSGAINTNERASRDSVSRSRESNLTDVLADLGFGSRLCSAILIGTARAVRRTRAFTCENVCVANRNRLCNGCNVVFSARVANS